MPIPPAPGFGDSIGAMTIAGGIMGALFHRERTGEATTVDVSLLGTGLWAMGQAVALSLVLDVPWRAAAGRRHVGQPAVAELRDQGRPDALASPACRPASTGPPLCEAIGRPELATDPRFADHAVAHGQHAARRSAILTEVFAAGTLDEWRERLESFTGQWAVVQDTLEAADDPQTVANGYLQDCETAVRHAVPARGRPGAVRRGAGRSPGRAPELNEHGDAILAELGLDWDAIVDLKVRGVVA